MHLALLATIGTAFASPDDDAEDPAVEVVVEGERRQDSASARSLDREALEALPARSADDVLRAMPGLHLSAHGGHGKAYQYFLRGFDAVHGADLAVEVEGVPINEPSNVHANGYLDLHFIPPVLLSSVDLWPGPFRADVGNFAVAGSAAFHLGLEESVVWAGGGTDQSAEATLAWRPANSRPGTFLVADATLGEGVGMNRGWRQVRGGGGVEGTIGTTEARAWVLAYDGVFESPGVLRLDDYEGGEVGFYDAYRGSGGGHSTRVLGGARLNGGDAQLLWQVSAWGGWRTLRLQQNFTGWAGDGEHGDGTRQDYASTAGGARARVGWTPTKTLLVQGGVDTRADRLRQAEEGVRPSGEPWGGPVTEQDGTQLEVGGWLTAPWMPVDGLRVEPGLRADAFLIAPTGSELSWAPAVGPKLAVVAAENGPVTGFASYGRGYRSPDIRGVGTGGRAPLAIANSVEVGGRATPSSWLALRVAGFGTRVSDEIVFDHVAARYLATGTTRRLGVDGGVTVQPVERIRLQGDLTWSDGRYTRSGTPIPYAPRLLGNLGVYAQRVPLGRALLSAGLRCWVLGPRPLPGGFASQTAAVADWTSTVRLDRWRLSLEVDNMLGNRWRDGEFAFASRWDRDAPQSELPVRHFTAGAPTAARLSLGRSF